MPMYYVLKKIFLPPKMAMMKIPASFPHGMDALGFMIDYAEYGIDPIVVYSAVRI